MYCGQACVPCLAAVCAQAAQLLLGLMLAGCAGTRQGFSFLLGPQTQPKLLCRKSWHAWHVQVISCMFSLIYTAYKWLKLQ